MVMDKDGNIFEERRKSDRRSASGKKVTDERRKSDRRVEDINGTPRKRKVNKI